MSYYFLAKLLQTNTLRNTQKHVFLSVNSEVFLRVFRKITALATARSAAQL